MIFLDRSWDRRRIVKAFPCKLILWSELTLFYMYLWKFLIFLILWQVRLDLYLRTIAFVKPQKSQCRFSSFLVPILPSNFLCLVKYLFKWVISTQIEFFSVQKAWLSGFWSIQPFNKKQGPVVLTLAHKKKKWKVLVCK